VPAPRAKPSLPVLLPGLAGRFREPDSRGAVFASGVGTSGSQGRAVRAYSGPGSAGSGHSYRRSWSVRTAAKSLGGGPWATRERPAAIEGWRPLGYRHWPFGCGILRRTHRPGRAPPPARPL